MRAGNHVGDADENGKTTRRASSRPLVAYWGFADELATRAGMVDAIDEDKQHTVTRVKAVLEAKGLEGTRSTFNAS